MNTLIPTVLIPLLLISAGCSGGDSSDGSSGPCTEAAAVCNGKASPKIDWASVPASMNPHVERQEFSLSMLRQIELNFFGFSEDVALVYSDSLGANSGEIAVYSVRSEDSKISLRNYRKIESDGKIQFARSGTYNCSLAVEDRKINALDGACYVRIVVTLPPSAKVELYIGSTLVSKRFYGMTNSDFLSWIEEPMHRDQKAELVDEYIASYNLVAASPSLTANEVSKVLNEFGFGDDRMMIFSKIHQFVTDRESLRTVISDRFNSFDEPRALEIAGLRKL